MNSQPRTIERNIAILQAIKRNDLPKNIATEFGTTRDNIYKIKRRYFGKLRLPRFGGPINPMREIKFGGPIWFIKPKSDKSVLILPSILKSLSDSGLTTPLKIYK